MAKEKTSIVIPIGEIEERILLIRGHRVILAADLARMYGVAAKRLNEQVKRNADRFPDDFVFQLSGPESEVVLRSQIPILDVPTGLKSQIATSMQGEHVKYLPCAFIEHKALMAPNPLKRPPSHRSGTKRKNANPEK